MHLWRALSPRIVLLALVCGIVGTIGAAPAAGSLAAQLMARHLAPLILRQLEETELGRCRKNPSHWALELSAGLRVDAYDVESFATVHERAPTIPPEIRRRFAQGNSSAASVNWMSDPGFALAFRTEREGPCSLFQVSWPRDVSQRRWGLLQVLATVLLPVFFAAGLGMVLLVRPLSSRIRADAAEIVERKAALERHLADVAHDLRTPIASLQLLLEEAAQKNPAEPLLRQTLEETVYLSGLTDNLWVASQLRDGRDPVATGERTDLVSVVETVAARFRKLAKQRSVDLQFARPDMPVWVHASAVMAQQAVGNLVQNAVNYGEPGGHVALVLDLLTVVGGKQSFCLMVVDDGPGVPPSELPKLGDRTFRSDATRKRDPSGGGLGLAITAEVCRRCGFDLSFSLEEPRGLKVTIRGSIATSRG